MMIEVAFDEQKAKALGYTAGDCYFTFEKWMKKYPCFKKVGKGAYHYEHSQEAAEGHFFHTATFMDCDWFLKTICAWYGREFSDRVEDREDYIKVFSKVYPDKAKKYGLTKSLSLPDVKLAW